MNQPPQTKEQFQAAYSADRPHVVWGETWVSLPCTCEYDGGPTHWAAVRNAPDAIEAHEEHEKVLASLRAGLYSTP